MKSGSDPPDCSVLHSHRGRIDRLVHHSIIVELNIPSYRVQAAKKQEKKSA